jgi:hypothetical protein
MKSTETPRYGLFNLSFLAILSPPSKIGNLSIEAAACFLLCSLALGMASEHHEREQLSIFPQTPKGIFYQAL